MNEEIKIFMNELGWYKEEHTLKNFKRGKEFKKEYRYHKDGDEIREIEVEKILEKAYEKNE